MAIAIVGETGKASFSTGATTLVIPVTTAPGAGSTLILRGAGTVAITSVTDTKLNTWTIDKASTSSPLALIARTQQDVGTLTTSDTITINYSASSNPRAGIVDEFTGLATVGLLDQIAAGTGTTTARTGGTTSATLQAAELVVGCFALGTAETGFTPGAGYTAFTTQFLGAVSGEYKIVAATGTQNPTATGVTSASSHGVTATYRAATVPANSVAPAVTGSAVVGQTLTTDNGTWTG